MANITSGTVEDASIQLTVAMAISAAVSSEWLP